MAIAHANVAAMLKKHDFQEIRKVGEGSFGKAVLVQSVDGSRLICKMVDVSKASRKEMEDAVKEGRLLAELKHPYIVRYRESFTENGWLCILMDFCEGGDLTKQIEEGKRRRQPIPEDRILKWFTQAIMALKYIHDKHILHRDLKPSNFFLSKGGSVKMGDFGIAKVLACTIAVAKTQIGTPYYLSPELCQERPYAWPSDIWSMGCILFELCALRVPFDAPSIAALVQKICKGTVPSIPSSYSSFLSHLCTELLCRTPDRRPGTTEILERPHIQAVVEKMVEEVQDMMPAAAAVRPRHSSSGPSSASRDPAGPVGSAAPYTATAGTFAKGDLIEYWSSSHKDWLPAVITAADDGGRICIDLKPNTWITPTEQATRVRSRKPTPEVRQRDSRAPSPSPMIRRDPSLQRCPSAGGRSPKDAIPPQYGGSPGSRPASRGPSPGPSIHRTPSAVGVPRCASNPAFERPARGASPMRPRSPSVGRLSSAIAGCHRQGDHIDYYSPSHKEWLPAVVINTDQEGRILIDLKPNTWLTREDQNARVRRRGTGSGGPPVVAASPRGCGAGIQRTPSAVGLVTPRAGTPSRGSSPNRWRVPSRDPLPHRAESPGLGMRRGSAGEVAGAGTPRIRPGLPPGIPRVCDSPLRHGGRQIAGAA